MFVCIYVYVGVLCYLCAAVLEAAQRWRMEKESRLSGEKHQEEEEEESIYTVHHEEVHFTFQELPGFSRH